MKPARNRERILKASVELFNQRGVANVTTNHIAAYLRISPGNLYFHFHNKEEIIRELFEQMCAATYLAWQPAADKSAPLIPPIEFIRRAFEVFWDYRFFHREMYYLRRKDPVLTKRWKKHLQKTMRLLIAAYHKWVDAGLMNRIHNVEELRLLADVVLLTSSAFLQFYESPERPATKRPVNLGVTYIARLLLPHTTEDGRREFLR